jgi:hypothetical protein
MEMKYTDMQIDATKIMQDKSSRLMITELIQSFAYTMGFLKAYRKYIFTKMMHILEHFPLSIILKNVQILKANTISVAGTAFIIR